MSKRFHGPMIALVLFAVSMSVIAGQMKLQKFRAGMLVPDDASVQFEDAAGRPISFEQFAAAARGGSFSKDIDPAAKKAVFRINNPSVLRQSVSNATALNVGRGQPLPATSLTTLAGESWTPVAKDGRYTLLSFYFDECVPCIAEIPALNAYAHAHPEMRVLAVTFDEAARAEVSGHASSGMADRARCPVLYRRARHSHLSHAAAGAPGWHAGRFIHGFGA